jgi:hypothetical protein
MQYMGKRDFEGEIEMFLPVLVAGDLIIAAHDDDVEASDMTVMVSLNGVPVEIPMAMHKFALKADNGDFQLLTAQVSGKAPDNLATQYPTNPTGTSSLLEKAVNQPGTALAFAFTTHATEGVALTGNMVWAGFDFSIPQEGGVVKTNYSWESQGKITPVQN